MDTSIVRQASAAVEKKDEELPSLEIRAMQDRDSHEVKEFCLNNLMQRTRLSNQFVYSSPIWLSFFLTCIAWATKTVEPWKRADWGRWAFLCCAISAMFLVGVDYFTYGHYEHKTAKAHQEDLFLKAPQEFLAKKKGKCWIARYADGLVGCVVLQRPTPKSETAEITSWFVRARYREKGLGGDLLREVIAECKATKCKKVTIQTSSINKRANQTLARFGFTKESSKVDPNVYWRLLRIRNTTWSINPQTMDLAQSASE